jgi:hypothetical protein
VNDPTTSSHEVPMVCNFEGAGDTPAERVIEYRQLMETALVGRERTVSGGRFRFRADDGIEAWVRDLAEREARCCPFFSFTITVAGGEVMWDATVIDDDTAWAILDEFMRLPETLGAGEDATLRAYAGAGLQFAGDPSRDVSAS